MQNAFKVLESGTRLFSVAKGDKIPRVWFLSEDDASKWLSEDSMLKVANLSKPITYIDQVVDMAVLRNPKAVAKRVVFVVNVPYSNQQVLGLGFSDMSLISQDIPQDAKFNKSPLKWFSEAMPVGSQYITAPYGEIVPFWVMKLRSFNIGQVMHYYYQGSDGRYWIRVTSSKVVHTNPPTLTLEMIRSADARAFAQGFDPLTSTSEVDREDPLFPFLMSKKKPVSIG